MDYGVYDKSNVPLTAHNKKLWTLYRTEVNFSDFSAFVEVDVNDVVRDKVKKGFQPSERDFKNKETLSKIGHDTVFSRS